MLSDDLPKLEFVGFDILAAAVQDNFVKQDWFTMQPTIIDSKVHFVNPLNGNPVPCERLIIGLNPPYGTKGQTAIKFINHALKFQPRLVV